MRRGEVWWVNFDPSVGGETQKIRPAIIVSNDLANKTLNRIQVVPTTSNVTKCYPCETYVEIESKLSKAMADQIATVSKQRLKSKIGNISAENLLAVENVIRIQLDL